jgi:hypothetical protein
MSGAAEGIGANAPKVGFLLHSRLAHDSDDVSWMFRTSSLELP